jgi:hypothetical protein
LPIAHHRAVAVVLLAHVGQDQVGAAEQRPDVLPDQRLDVALADGAQLTAARGGARWCVAACTRSAHWPPRHARPAAGRSRRRSAGRTAGRGGASCAASARA